MTSPLGSFNFYEQVDRAIEKKSQEEGTFCEWKTQRETNLWFKSITIVTTDFNAPSCLPALNLYMRRGQNDYGRANFGAVNA